MIKNKPLIIIVFFLVVSIIIAIYFQYDLVKRIYFDKKVELESDFIEHVEHALYLTEKNKKSTEFDHQSYHETIGSYILKSKEVSYEMEDVEFYNYIFSVNNSEEAQMFKLVAEDINDIKRFLEETLEKEKLNIEYRLDFYKTISFEAYQKEFKNSDLLIKYPFGTFGIYFKNDTSIFLSVMMKILLSSLFFILTITFCGTLLIKKYLKEKKLSLYKNEFINNLTHELQTPLTVSRLAIEKINVDLKESDKHKKYLSIIEKENRKLEKLSKRILKLAELKTLAIKSETINLTSSIERVINRHCTIITDEDILLTDLNHLNIELKGSKELFLDLLDNLVSNAIKYSVSPRVIVIKTNIKNGNLHLSVKDNGIGIPKEFEDKIFSPFFKVPKNNTHEVKSNGLGLSYVAEIVKQMKGTITMQSEIDKGTTFNIILPYEN